MATTCKTLAQLDEAVARDEIVLFIRGVALMRHVDRRRTKGTRLWLTSIFFMLLTISATFFTSIAAQSQLTELVPPDAILNAGAFVLFIGITAGLGCAIVASRIKLRRYKVVRRGKDWALLRQV